MPTRGRSTTRRRAGSTRRTTARKTSRARTSRARSRTRSTTRKKRNTGRTTTRRRRTTTRRRSTATRVYGDHDYPLSTPFSAGEEVVDHEGKKLRLNSAYVRRVGRAGEEEDPVYVPGLDGCRPGYERSAMTGLCYPRPCDEPGQVRNPITGVCQDLKCRPGYVLNRDTNKCVSRTTPEGRILGAFERFRKTQKDAEDFRRQEEFVNANPDRYRLRFNTSVPARTRIVPDETKKKKFLESALAKGIPQSAAETLWEEAMK